jgi:endonuclease/exonuclease/phosphatase family metal-dependent hydrolase
MKIATWNVARPIISDRSKRLDRIIQEINHVNADIWILTETRPEVSPGITYSSIAPDDSFPGEKWVMIWSCYPIEKISIHCEYSRAVAAVVKPPDRKPIVVCGVVLPWVGSAWKDKKAAGGEAFAAALLEQTEEWKRLNNKYPTYDFVVAGDFNQNLGPTHFYGSKHNKEFLNATLKELDLECLTNSNMDPVFAQTHGEWQSVDHICTNPRLANTAKAPRKAWPEGSKPDKRLSDHFGAAVEFD